MKLIAQFNITLASILKAQLWHIMVVFPAMLVFEYLLYLPAVCFIFGFRLKALLEFCITTLVKLCKHYYLFALHLEGQNS